jgi:hypothetical protein
LRFYGFVDNAVILSLCRELVEIGVTEIVPLGKYLLVDKLVR